jgi:hypothetical protein
LTQNNAESLVSQWKTSAPPKGITIDENFEDLYLWQCADEKTVKAEKKADEIELELDELSIQIAQAYGETAFAGTSSPAVSLSSLSSTHTISHTEKRICQS